jgi:hypothetical protein
LFGTLLRKVTILPFIASELSVPEMEGCKFHSWQGSVQIRIPTEREDDCIDDEGTIIFLSIIAQASTFFQLLVVRRCFFLEL